MRIKSFLAKLLSITSLAVLTGGCVSFLLPVHVSIPVDLSKVGSVSETEFIIRSEDQFKIYLKFNSSKEWDKDLTIFLGGIFERERRLGAIIPVRLKIDKLIDAGKTTILDKEFATKEVSGISRYSVIRDITVVTLKSGKYTIRIENKKDFPELNQVPITLNIIYFRA